ncbi:MAG: STAS/SEC14 domain-containing protein [Pirellulales bacterium]|nr:STAS/SEC14 domain-containing protein [Pirellulales bacterium]
MLEVLTTADNVVELALQGTIRANDFDRIREHVDELIARHGAVRLLLDATEFEGWQDVEAAKTHFEFVKEHHDRVERIAVLGNRQWQHWLASAIGVFLHPEVKCFEPDEREAARMWLGEVD